MKTISSIILMILIFITGCGQKNSRVAAITEAFQTDRNEPANIDSPAVWHGPDGQHWLIATAKSADALYIDDAVTGKRIQIFGKSGNQPGELAYPNGISVLGDNLFVVERDNRRVQVFHLPDFESVGIIGETLINPYGLYVYKDSADVCHLYVTDNYQDGEDSIPPLAELNRRVHHYRFKIDGDTLISELASTFGDTTDAGALRIVESIYGDPENNRLMIAEEDVSRSAVKVYDLDGNFTGISLGHDVFKNQAEGIALSASEDGAGYWILTDQSHKANCFHLFSRKDLIYCGSFYGPKTTNTDGIWLTQESFGPFPKGAFYAVHNDGNVSAFDWEEIARHVSL